MSHMSTNCTLGHFTFDILLKPHIIYLLTQKLIQRQLYYHQQTVQNTPTNKTFFQSSGNGIGASAPARIKTAFGTQTFFFDGASQMCVIVTRLPFSRNMVFSPVIIVSSWPERRFRLEINKSQICLDSRPFTLLTIFDESVYTGWRHADQSNTTTQLVSTRWPHAPGHRRMRNSVSSIDPY